MAHIQIDQRNHWGQAQLNLANYANLEVEWVPNHQQEARSATKSQVADPRDHQLSYQPKDIDGVGRVHHLTTSWSTARQILNGSNDNLLSVI